MTKLEQAFELFDNYNKQSPEQIAWEGEVYPSEYFYALQLHKWVKRLDPDASEPLLLASRCQHIGRWESLRSSYPEGRIGYLKWRSDLSKFHAQKATELLSSIDYAPEVIDRVCEIVLKRRLKVDEDVQTMENALCLVFLEFQYDDLIEKQPEEKMIDILQKTWSKMTEPGKKEALALNFSEKGKMLIDNALA